MLTVSCWSVFVAVLSNIGHGPWVGHVWFSFHCENVSHLSSLLLFSHFACFCRMWVSVCVWVYVYTYHYECVEVVGELEVCSLLLPCGVQGSNLSCHTWHWVLYLQSHLTILYIIISFTKIFRIIKKKKDGNRTVCPSSKAGLWKPWEERVNSLS